ncbi:MAG TPA: DUF4412 domain-containing protein [Chthoniobacteraceae bacterium]|jgi:hypothetical protein|nr:DUF4412 domain-containing protein [Chthoniobacteraceae bacterium]
MKFTLWLAAFCVTFSIAHADLVVEQKMESPVINGVVKIKVKANLARVEAPTPVGNTVSIFDLEKGKMTILMEAQNVAMEMDLGAMKAQAAALQKDAGAEALKPTATGNKKKVGEWDAEEYTLTTQGVTMHLWIAPNFPNGKVIAQEMGKLSQGMSVGTPDPNALGLPGVVVLSEVDTPIGKVTTTLQSAKQTPVDAKEFVVPEGYKVVQPPAGLGGK